MKKATYANGIVHVYDENVEAPATHYGDENGVQHRVVSTVDAPADAVPGFTAPSSPPSPAPAESS